MQPDGAQSTSEVEDEPEWGTSADSRSVMRGMGKTGGRGGTKRTSKKTAPKAKTMKTPHTKLVSSRKKRAVTVLEEQAAEAD